MYLSDLRISASIVTLLGSFGSETHAVGLTSATALASAVAAAFFSAAALASAAFF